MNIEEICIDDRFRVFEKNNIKVSFVKAAGIDLAVKYMILLRNSLGKKNASSCIFVDEVKNSSMIINMRNTMKHFKERQENFLVCNFREKEKEHIHVKIGYGKVFVLFISFLFQYGLGLIGSLLFGRKSIRKKMSQIIIKHIIRYIEVVEQGRDDKKFYMMTDHNFFSTVFAMACKGKTNVLQHGLILDKTYYWPILADEFYAWGEESKKKLNYDMKVKVKGTYKFDSYVVAPQNDDGSVLYCISILDNDIVKEKIDTLLKATKELGLKFKVKTHPGSFFNAHGWKELYKEEDIEFYQEESLLDIPFQTAVIENSTIMLDMLYLNKNIIVYDDVEGYFGQYADVIPFRQDYEGIKSALMQNSKEQWLETQKSIMDMELCGGQCLI